VRELKILAAKLDLRQNYLMEEAIPDLIKKYEQKEPSMNASNVEQIAITQAFN
jgi:hypothetical protein